MTIRLPRVGLLAGDHWQYSLSGGIHEHVNPATGKVQGKIALSGPAEVDEAVGVARAAFSTWRAMSPARRRDILLQWTALMTANLDKYLQLCALESGRPLSQGTSAHEWMAYYAGWADKIDGEYIAAGDAGGMNYVVPDPYGVVGVIVPFNGPVEIASMTAIPALAAGNCVVLKPPEVTPYSCVLFADLALEAGLPPGVLNVIVGGSAAGQALVTHPGVDKISFTGSPATARHIMAAAAPTLTPLALELGGKSVNLVFADADLPAAAAFSATLALVPCSGQACVLPTRLLVAESAADEFVDLLSQTVSTYTVGMPMDPGTTMGPVISETAMRRILGVIETARSTSVGQLVTGGSRVEGELSGGFFVAPTIFRDVDTASPLSREEIFGPVLTVSTFDSEERGLAMANDSDYGLGAFVQTLDVRRAHRVADRLEAGYVSVNGFNGLQPGVPFGGTKQSGFGREGGLAGLKEFLRPKNVYISTAQ